MPFARSLLAAACSAVCLLDVQPALHEQAIPATGSNWGLDRLDQRTPDLDGVFHYSADGSGVSIFVLDTGAWVTHEDFGGRVTNVADGRPLNFCAGTPDEDVDGHGTHTASIAAGRTYGVAKNATVYALKVFGPGCRGTDPVIAALDEVVRRGGKPGVVNLSSGSFGDNRVIAKVVGVARAGFAVVLSAACTANTNNVWGEAARNQANGIFIVGSTARGDVAPPRIDYGPALTMFAPAIDITAAQTGYPDRMNNASTSVYPPQANPTCADSFAAPHVAGVVATYLQSHRDATPEQVYAALIGGPARAWTKGVRNHHGAPDRMLHSMPGGF